MIREIKFQLLKLLFINVILFLSVISLVYAQEADKFIYDNHSKRDPFIPLVGISHAIDRGAREIIRIEDVDFQGIAKDAKGKKIIIINGEMLREGAKLDALTVKKIADNEAIVIIRGKDYKLTLYEEGGRK